MGEWTGRLRLRNNVDSTDLSEVVKSYEVPCRTEPNGVVVPVSPVFIVDPSVIGATSILARAKTVICDSTGTVYAALATLGANLAQTTGLLVGSAQYLTNMLTPNLEASRTPSKFVTLALTIAAGDTVVWPLNATKKIRVMGYTISLASGTSAAAASTIQLRDNATVVFTHAISGAAMAAPGVPVIIAHVNLPGNGYLSAAVNTPWNLNLSSALAVGGVAINMWGTEE